MNRQKNVNAISYINFNAIHPAWYLIVGIIWMSLSHLRFSVDVLAWISMAPFLLFLKVTNGWKSRLWFALALLFAWTLIIIKIITAPLPVFFALLYSIPITLLHLPGYLVWARFKDLRWSIFIFPALMVIMEWLQYTFTPLASWGVAAYTQVHSLIISQTLSLFGMAGLSFMIYWVNISLVELLSDKRITFVNVFLPCIILVLLLGFGSLRIDQYESKGAEMLTLAAVGTDSEIRGLPLPADDENEGHIRSIFDRTRKAADGGAELVVWNEAAFFLYANEEQAWVDSISVLARELDISIVAAYVVPFTAPNFHYENKYLFVLPDGTVDHSYLKHEPVPGEPAIKGTSGLKAVPLHGTSVGGAICYDYDFPYLAKENVEAGAAIAAVPSSDWRGIDPLHTKMASYRAIEQGHSILRSTRFGLSAAITPIGEMKASMSSFDKNDKIMLAQLPKKGVTTLYGRIGDVVVYFSIVFLVSLIIGNFAYSKKIGYLIKVLKTDLFIR